MRPSGMSVSDEVSRETEDNIEGCDSRVADTSILAEKDEIPPFARLIRGADAIKPCYQPRVTYLTIR